MFCVDTAWVCVYRHVRHTFDTLKVESSQRVFVLVYSAVEGKACMSLMAQLQLPYQSCLRIRGYLCLTNYNKGSALLALFGHELSTIISFKR